jgi:hypothetical protein
MKIVEYNTHFYRERYLTGSLFLFDCFESTTIRRVLDALLFSAVIPEVFQFS